MPSERRQARILAMQALCQWDAQHDESPDHLREFFAAQGASQDATDYAASIVDAFWSQREDIDRRIASAADRWEFSRISPVERNIMRVAVVELCDRRLPPKVALNEAIDLGRQYGGQDSSRFINGVLDQVLKTMQETETDGG